MMEFLAVKRASVAFVLLGLLGLNFAPALGQGTGKKLKVFLLAGQSNMEGKGDGGKLTETEKKDLEAVGKRVRLAYDHEPIRPLSVTEASAGLKKKFEVESVFGPELFFGLKMAAAWPDQEFLFIKRSVGATSLYGRWNPDWTAEKAAKMGEEKAPPLYADFIGYVREVLGAYKPEEYEICGMLWVQGEADGDPKRGIEPAEAYGENLQNLITRVRKDTGVPELPFLLVQVGFGQVTEGMQATAGAMKNVSLIPQSKDPASPNFFPKYPVGHYNYEGMKRIGSLLADEYLKRHATHG